MCKCSPDCMYFPSEVYEDGIKNSVYVDAKGTRHFYELPKMCRYDWHSIKEWEKCSHFRNIFEEKDIDRMRKKIRISYPVLIICGESAAGKDTILKSLKQFGFEDIVSYTTRPIREGEQQDKEYHFIEKEKFLEMMHNEEFAETRYYNTLFNGVPDTWYYGLAKKDLVLDGSRKVCIVDPIGAKQIIDSVGAQNCLCVYIETDENTRLARAVERGSFSEEEWNRRQVDDKKRFTTEFFMNYVDLCINNNGSLLDTTKQLYSLYFDYFE